MQSAPPLIAFSFIGTSPYKPTRYSWLDRQCLSPYFPVALGAFIPGLSALHVFATTKAEQENGGQLRRAALDANLPLQIHHIPTGASDAELWEIFSELVRPELVPAGSQLVLDVTHSFRTIPLAATLAAAYLGATRGVAIRHMLYGAFEARKEDGDGPSETPVFDLRPMVSLLDWLSAVTAFRDTFDCSRLQGLLTDIQNNAHKARLPEAPRTLKGLGSSLEGLSLALRLGPIRDVHKVAAAIREILANGEKSIPREALVHARPLIEILPLLKDTIEQFPEAAPRATTPNDDLRIARICFEHGLLAQCSTLMREWLVSKVIESCVPPGGHAPEDGDKLRSLAEDFLNQEMRIHVAKWRTRLSKSVIALWDRIRETRNSINHYGYRKEPIDSARLKSQIEKQIEDCEALADSGLFTP